jgi:hypothetical protein
MVTVHTFLKPLLQLYPTLAWGDGGTSGEGTEAFATVPHVHENEKREFNGNLQSNFLVLLRHLLLFFFECAVQAIVVFLVLPLALQALRRFMTTVYTISL